MLLCQVRVLFGDHFARVLHLQGKLTGAEFEVEQRQILETRRRVYGDPRPDTLMTMCSFAWLLESRGKLEEAERLCREGLETARRVLGDEHHRTLFLIGSLGHVLRARGDLAAAEPLRAVRSHA